MLKTRKRPVSHTRQTLASLLDFGACANDYFDGNDFSFREYRATLRLLEGTEVRVEVNEYIGRLSDLENRRPAPGGGVRQYRKAQDYRESVIRLSLGMVAATVLENVSIEDGIRATHCEADLQTLFRIVMLCQIIDDVLDVEADIDNRLPSFMTAHASPFQALALAADARAGYADRSDLPSSPQLFPFRVALLGISILANTVIMLRHWRLRSRTLPSFFRCVAHRRASTDAHT